MKKTIILAVGAILTLLYHSCSEPQQVNPDSPSKTISCAIIIDGTDVESNQSSIPVITTDYITNLCESLRNTCDGQFFLTYVDDNSSNNETQHISFRKKCLTMSACPKKQPFWTDTQYQDSVAKYRGLDSVESMRLQEEIFLIHNSAQEIIEHAYAQRVLSNRKGSDIYGAITNAVRAVESVRCDAKYLVIISDCKDNVGKVICDIPSSIHIIVVCESFPEAIPGVDNIIQLPTFDFVASEIANR